MRFKDRTDAGRDLAARLQQFANRHDVIVLGLPRGGVPVAHEVARALNAPLDVFLVRKLGVPGHAELAMGAIASGGVRVVNHAVVDRLGITEADIDRVAEAEQRELERREVAFRSGRAPLDLRGRVAMLVDDGLATGSTMKAAAVAARQHDPSAVVIAVPAAPRATCAELRADADDVICVITPDAFYAVGQWYDDFDQTSDDEVVALLDQALEGG